MEQKKFMCWHGDDLLLSVYAAPNASQDYVQGLYQAHIKIQITAPAVESKANMHLQKWLAKEFKVAKSDVSLTKGEHSRYKLFIIKSPKQLPVWLTNLTND